MQISFCIFAVWQDFLADLEFVPVEDEHLQEALHPGQSQVKITLWVRVVSDLLSGSVLDGAVHCPSEGAHTSPHAGDISLDLAEEV